MFNPIHRVHPQNSPFYRHYSPVRYPSPYPEVNTEQLQMSAQAFKPLMKDANKILESFTNSNDFAYKVMDAAQKSETEKVKQYIKEIGITREVEIKYNPDSIRLKLINQTNQLDCCKLSISLQW